MTPQEFLAKPTSRYSDWFGKGDSHTDYHDAVKEHGSEPKEVLQDGYMLCLIWDDKVVTTGYDGNEYFQTFTFTRNHQ